MAVYFYYEDGTEIGFVFGRAFSGESKIYGEVHTTAEPEAIEAETSLVKAIYQWAAYADSDKSKAPYGHELCESVLKESMVN